MTAQVATILLVQGKLYRCGESLEIFSVLRWPSLTVERGRTRAYEVMRIARACAFTGTGRIRGEKGIPTKRWESAGFSLGGLLDLSRPRRARRSAGDSAKEVMLGRLANSSSGFLRRRRELGSLTHFLQPAVVKSEQATHTVVYGEPLQSSSLFPRLEPETIAIWS